MEIKQIKETLKVAKGIFDCVEQVTDFQKSLNLDANIHMYDILKLELLRFLAYVAVSDGVISWKECRFMAELLDANATPKSIDELIRENDIYSTEFEEKVPLSFHTAVVTDNLLYENGEGEDLELGHLLYVLYGQAAVGLVEANGRTVDTMEPAEKENIHIYLGMLKSYIEDNTKKHHTDLIANYTKKQKLDFDIRFEVPEKKLERKRSVKAPGKRR